ncbi:hypothetical protein HGRIS_003551 [Hohenbuehelia grisea]|uniref:Uncharacterized protein n=1 Tax=Hohenbuehelia grisea TaxID=104357 RepID=A0ABR3JG98_9AGAR
MVTSRRRVLDCLLAQNIRNATRHDFVYISFDIRQSLPSLIPYHLCTFPSITMQFFKSLPPIVNVHAFKAAASSTLDRGRHAFCSQLGDRGCDPIKDAIAHGADRFAAAFERDGKLALKFSELVASSKAAVQNAFSSPANATAATTARQSVAHRLAGLLEKIKDPKVPKASPTIKAVVDACPTWTKTSPLVNPPSEASTLNAVVVLGFVAVLAIGASAYFVAGKKDRKADEDNPRMYEVVKEKPVFETVYADGADISKSRDILPTILAFLSGMVLTFHKTTTPGIGWQAAFEVTSLSYASFLIFEAIFMVVLRLGESQHPATSTFLYALQLPLSLFRSIIKEFETYLCPVLIAVGNMTALCPTGDEEDEDEVFIYVGISSPYWFRLYHKALELITDTRNAIRSFACMIVGAVVVFGLGCISPDLDSAAIDVLFDLSGFKGTDDTIYEVDNANAMDVNEIELTFDFPDLRHVDDVKMADTSGSYVMAIGRLIGRIIDFLATPIVYLALEDIVQFQMCSPF